MAKPRLKVSFSGGSTSAYMSYRIKQELADKYELLFIFANTAQENEQTLEFVDKCDKAWNLGVVWVEAVVHPQYGKGTTHRVVDFASASRDGQPFEDMIRQYGIPNKKFPHCTRELKQRPLYSYMREIGWDDYQVAIGIRTDEARRANAPQGSKIIYPLIDWWPTDKQDISDFWEDQPFRLELREHEGNCAWCWKKSDRKHIQLIQERPEIYDFPRRMEQEYGWSGAPDFGVPNPNHRSRVFFRQNRSVGDLFALANELKGGKLPTPDNRSMTARQMDLDLSGGCSESCEMYATE